jgi:hypothetical protein
MVTAAQEHAEYRAEVAVVETVNAAKVIADQLAALLTEMHDAAADAVRVRSKVAALLRRHAKLDQTMRDLGHENAAWGPFIRGLCEHYEETIVLQSKATRKHVRTWIKTLYFPSEAQPMPERFKVGDRVQYVSDRHRGAVGTVKSITGIQMTVQYDGGDGLYSVSTGGFNLIDAAPEVEAPEPQASRSFKLNDRVRITARTHDNTGRIVAIVTAISGVIFRILTDERHLLGDWSPSNLQLIDAAPEAEAPEVEAPQPITENIMSKINTPVVVTRTFVLDQDVATMTDDQLYNAITTVGAEIERLEKVQPAPKKLIAKIAELKEHQQQIVDLVDAR